MTTPNRYGPKGPQNKQLSRFMEEAMKRQSRVASLDWNTHMFGPQREFIEDPSRLKVACCSRRAG